MADFNSALSLVAQAFGWIHVPARLLQTGGRFLIHLSDTPSFVYPQIERILRLIRPVAIIHTGDLADEVKLEFHPAFTDRYRNRAQALLRILGNSGAPVVVAIGNHDDASFLKTNASWCDLVEGAAVVAPSGFRCAVSHWADRARALNEEYSLFGHDVSMRTGASLDEHGPRYYLNGIDAISVIDIDSGERTPLHWPSGTDMVRMGRFKTGL